MRPIEKKKQKESNEYSTSSRKQETGPKEAIYTKCLQNEKETGLKGKN